MGALSVSLLRNPELDSWIRIDAAGTVTLFTGKVELGQGLRTAIARIGAEELDVSLDRIRVETVDTATGLDESATVSSLSMHESGNAIRQAAAEARAHLLSRAASILDTPAESLTVTDGSVVTPDGQRSVTYWDVAGNGFGVDVTGVVDPKPASERRIVGKSAPRIDLPDILTGRTRYVQDIAVEGMLHGRVVRPPSFDAVLETVDIDRIRQMPGVVAIVRDGNFLGVVAEREEEAIRAAEDVTYSARWREEPSLAPLERLSVWLRDQPTQDFPVIAGIPVKEDVPPIEVPEATVQTIAATYTRPLTMHASIGPSAAVAVWKSETSLTIWSSTQVPYVLRDELASVLGIESGQVRIVHVPGPGCYGHNGTDDAALDAALLARAVPGRAVSAKWSRADEHSWEAYGPPSVMELQTSIDSSGRVLDWNHDTWSNTHSARWPGQPGSWLIAAWHRDPPLARPVPQPMLMYHLMLHRNADPLYTFPRRRIVKHFVPSSPIRTTTLRGLGAFANVFALESFMDEVAEAVGMDPLAFRLEYLADDRGREVLMAAAERAGWDAKAQSQDPGRGIGIAFAQFKNLQTYAAIVVEIAVDDETAEIRLERATIAADAGEIVDPEGLANQLEGGFIQAASWTLKEQVTFDDTRITSVDWESYPILRFPEIPEVDTVLLDRPGYPFLGAGEAVAGPTPAAIANALYAATGVRARDLPLTPDKIRDAAAAPATNDRGV